MVMCEQSDVKYTSMSGQCSHKTYCSTEWIFSSAQNQKKNLPQAFELFAELC